MKTARPEVGSICKGRLRRPRWHNGLVWALILGIMAAGTLGLAQPRPAAAAPDPPVISSYTATFTGDQHLGITNTPLTGQALLFRDFFPDWPIFSLPPGWEGSWWGNLALRLMLMYLTNTTLVPDFATPPITTIGIQNLTTDITPSPPYLAGVYMQHVGANGKKGSGSIWNGGDGHNGDDGLGLTVYYYGGNHTLKVASSPYGIYLNSTGGKGGAGGKAGGAFGPGMGGDGGDGGLGGALILNSYSGPIETDAGYGIYARSKGGDGGDGGGGGSGISYGEGGKGGEGGSSSGLQLTNKSAINSSDSGITAFSFGGTGGDGGYAYGTSYGNGGDGGDGGSGGDVIVNNHGAITTQNQGGHGIDAESWGGTGGHGGTGDGAYGKGGDGGIGGGAGTVFVSSDSAISTWGSEAYGILAWSYGGAGGDGGGGGGIGSKGGAARGPAPGGYVYVSNSGNIETSGDWSRGIFAQSVGGYAGSGGSAGGIVAFGASGQSGGDGGPVSLLNNSAITSIGEGADALFAQSVGGGGGSGGSTGGLFTMGGSGDAGGQGGEVLVFNSGKLQTSGDSARGIYAQSVGGGGGDGGSTVSVAPTVSFAMGGQGGTGGDGGQVTVTNDNSSSINTGGGSADGVFAQSVGGGGGAGGYAVSAAYGGMTCSVALGGSGGSGGAGGGVKVDNSSGILTTGKMSTGLTAQSVGGGGGAAGFAEAASVGGINFDISLGGSAGSSGSNGAGGDGAAVDVTNHGDVSTQGEMGHGLFAQSAGGGGGLGGYSFSGSAGLESLTYAMGGKGGNGGAGGTVSLDNYGNLTTNGVGAYGILAESVGGGGGAGGYANSFAVSFGFLKIDGVPVPAVSLALAIGGEGGLGGDSQKVTVSNYGNITTNGAPVVAATEDDVIPVDNSACYGILAQSVGGGGGDGGDSHAGAMNLSFGTPSASVAVSVGGGGGSGGNGDQVEVTNTGTISTSTGNSIGIFAQSVGGGGGNGGVSKATARGMQADTEKKYSIQCSVGVGGWGGAGGNGEVVNVTDSGSVTTSGDNAIGILAQSVGGGGGNGGSSYAGDLSLASSFKVSASVGGSGGVAGSGGDVNVIKNGGDISTAGTFAPGILAQSIGGGGGNGGHSIDATLGSLSKVSTMKNNVSFSASVGGFGGAGNLGGAATVTNKADSTKDLLPADIFTEGDSSYGIFAQSVGGGGGNGAFSFIGTLSSTTGSDGETWYGGGVNLQVGATVGGSGGEGSDAGTVSADNDGDITTAGYKAYGILAQSIGGGGGVGGDSAMFNFMLPTKGTGELPAGGWNLNLNTNVGGFGGGAGQGNNVTVRNTGKIFTQGNDACGIFAQSVGGGGGTGGNAWRIPTPPLPIGGLDIKSFFKGLFNIEKLSVFVGGYGGASGDGKDVVVENYGDITTMGGVITSDSDSVDDSVHGSMGIFAQSVGGGGGTGGNANIGYKFANIGFGGEGGSAGDGGQVTVTNNGAISTRGQAASGIYAQSVGGGGGIAGSIVRSLFNEDPDQIPYAHYVGLSTGFGLGGGDGGSGGQVTVNNYGNITTRGDGAYGIFAQSVGGGGGTGGIDTGYPGKLIFHGSVFQGAPGDGGMALVHHEGGTITTNGEYAPAILAQSTSGSGTGGNVLVGLYGRGNVIANGNYSHGIQAQSLGAGSSSTIAVFLDLGTRLQGGAGQDSYGVLFMDGAANTLSNYGTITTASGVNGTAVMQQADYGAPARGNLTIDNSGTIIGSVNQCTQVLTDDTQQLAAGMSLPGGSSIINFNNYQGAVFNTGAIVNLGAGTLDNSGIVNLRGAASQVDLTGGATTVTGDVINQDSGIINIAHNPAIFNGSVKNCGQVKVTDTDVTWTGTFTNSGAYISDPATQTFTDLVVEDGGYLVGASQDLFLVTNDLVSHSTQSSSWNTAAANLSFIPGADNIHDFYLTGVDLGATWAGYSENFAWGSLDIEGQTVHLFDGNDTLRGALYVGEILGLDFGSPLIKNIYGHGLNIYYDPTLEGNAYLKSLTYELMEGGELRPTPVPASVLLLGSGLLGLGLLGWRRKRS